MKVQKVQKEGSKEEKERCKTCSAEIKTTSLNIMKHMRTFIKAIVEHILNVFVVYVDIY